MEETIRCALSNKLLRRHHVQKVNVDTTVQEKAITYPTDGKMVNYILKLYDIRQNWLREIIFVFAKVILVYLKGQPCLFPVLKIESFASAKLSTNASKHEQPFQRKAYQDNLPASLVSHVEPCLFRALKTESFAPAKLSTKDPNMSNPSNAKPIKITSQLRLFPMWSLAFFAPLNIESFALAKPTKEVSQLRLFPTRSLAFFAPLKPRALQSLPTQSFPRKPPQLRLFPMWSRLFRALKIGSFAPAKPTNPAQLSSAQLSSVQSPVYIVSLEKPEYYGSFAFISHSEVKSSTHNRKVL